MKIYIDVEVANGCPELFLCLYYEYENTKMRRSDSFSTRVGPATMLGVVPNSHNTCSVSVNATQLPLLSVRLRSDLVKAVPVVRNIWLMYICGKQVWFFSYFFPDANWLIQISQIFYFVSHFPRITSITLSSMEAGTSISICFWPRWQST